MMSYEFPHPVSKTYRYKKVSKIERNRLNIYFISCNIINYIFYIIKIFFFFILYKNLRDFIYKNKILIIHISFICLYLAKLHIGLLFYLQQITKPLLERKRRARINKCLDELKNLMIDALEVRICYCIIILFMNYYTISCKIAIFPF